MNTLPENTALLNKSLLMEAAFNAPNNRSVIFTAIRDADNTITDFEFTLLSPATLAITGKDITGTKISQSAPDYRNLLPDMVQVIETGVTNEWERCVDYMEGGPRWYKVTDSKAGECIIRHWDDITDQKQLITAAKEETARKTEEKYLALFNSNEQGFCIVEMIFDERNKPIDYIFVDFNPAFEKQTGLVNAKGVNMKTLAPDHEKHWFEIYGRVAKTHEPIQFEQVADNILDGVWYEVSAFPLTKEYDNLVGVIFHDVTERKKIEREKEAFSHILEEQVKERTSELDEINHLLEEKNEELGRTNKELESFTYIASHDLQEPLRKLQTFTGLLSQHLENPERARAYMDKINTTTARMSSLISDVLQYKKLSADALVSDVNLNVVMGNIMGDYELIIAEKQAKISTDSLPTIRAVNLQMHQLFSNLLSNALKYSKRLPVVISITAKNFDVDGTAYVQITFKDNGIGFDNKYSDQIFNLFQRLHGKTEYSGTGIGLSICKKIAEQHGGSISAHSVPDEGTAFIITLPIDNPAVT